MIYGTEKLKKWQNIKPKKQKEKWIHILVIVKTLIFSEVNATL